VGKKNEHPLNQAFPGMYTVNFKQQSAKKDIFDEHYNLQEPTTNT
jgi:hypothetical protein